MTLSTQQTAKHGIVARIFHWLTPLLLAYGFFRNGNVTGALTDPAAMTREIWFGVAVLAVFALRFIWMHGFNGGASRLPADAPKWERRGSKFGHLALYGFVAAIVLTGFSIPLAQTTGNAAMVDAASGFHEGITNVGVAFLGLHIAAALWHKLARNDGIWESIGTPGFEPRRFAAFRNFEGWTTRRLVPRLDGWYARIRKYIPVFLR